MVPTIDEIERSLREADLRVTRPRIAVLTAVHSNPHADTNSIIDSVRLQLGDVSHQAVYDVAPGVDRRRTGATDPAVRLGCALRGPRRRQPPPRRLPLLRRGRRRRLRGRRGPMPDPARTTTATQSMRPRSSTGACAPAVPTGKLTQCRPRKLTSTDSRKDLPVSDTPDAVVGEMNDDERHRSGGCPVRARRAHPPHARATPTPNGGPTGST